MRLNPIQPMTLILKGWGIDSDTFTVAVTINRNHMLVLYDLDWEGVVEDYEMLGYPLHLPPEEWK